MTLVSLGSNIFSLRAQRALSRADDLQSTSALRLSSGSRINSASDDAAGLAVADSLRVKQRLFSGAIRNTNDGISMLNIIDGSLANQSDIVMRLAELAEQSASGTLTNSQRGSLDKEYQSLVAEFTRVADGTTFNGLNLLRSQRGDGVSSMLLQLGITGASTSQVAVTTQDTSRFSGVLTKSMLNSSADGEIDAVDFDVIISTLSGANPYDLHPGASTFTVRGSDGRDHELLMYAMDYADAANFGSTYTGGNPVVSFHILEHNTDGSYSEIDGAPLATFPSANSAFFALTFDKNSGRCIDTVDTSKLVNFTATLAGAVTANISLDFSALTFSLDPSTAGSALDYSSVRTQSSARVALVTDQNRLAELDRSRSVIGALMSRLKVNNSVLSVARENFAAAESRIRDVDVAEESANYTRLNILKQSSIAILAQANQQPKMLLEILKQSSSVG